MQFVQELQKGGGYGLLARPIQVTAIVGVAREQSAAAAASASLVVGEIEKYAARCISVSQASVKGLPCLIAHEFRMFPPERTLQRAAHAVPYRAQRNSDVSQCDLATPRLQLIQSCRVAFKQGSGSNPIDDVDVTEFEQCDSHAAALESTDSVHEIANLAVGIAVAADLEMRDEIVQSARLAGRDDGRSRLRWPGDLQPREQVSADGLMPEEYLHGTSVKNGTSFSRIARILKLPLTPDCEAPLSRCKTSMMLLHDLLDASVQRLPDAPALQYRGTVWSYARLQASSLSAAAGLQRLGIGKGDRVAIHLPNRPEAVELAIACSRLGAVFIPLNPGLRARQLGHVLKDSGARAVVTSGSILPQLTIAELQNLRFVICADTPCDPQGLVHGVEVLELQELRVDADVALAHAVSEEDLAALFYTSGSTGLPKGVMLSHRNLVSGAQYVAQYLANQASDRILAVLPWSFDYGFNQITTALHVGACAVLTGYVSPAALLKELYEERITALAGVPTIWMQLAAAHWPDAAPAQLRYITNSGGTLHRATILTLQRLLPDTQIFCMYGLTEAFRSTYLDPRQLSSRMGSIGKAVAHQEVIVVDDNGRPCGSDEIGELVHRGSFVSLGYWNDPQLTAQRFRPFPVRRAGQASVPAVWSGDLVRMDADGFLYFVGRKDQQIKTSGVRVSPTEIEEVVAELPGIVEGVAVGVPDELLGQRLVLHVIASAAQTEMDERLREHCRRQLPAYLSISHIVFHSAFPRTSTGKPDRAALAAASAQVSDNRPRGPAALRSVSG